MDEQVVALKEFRRFVRKGARRNQVVFDPTRSYTQHLSSRDVQRLYARLKNRKRVGGKRKKTT